MLGQAGFHWKAGCQWDSVTYSVPEFTMSDAVINGKKVNTIELPGVFLPQCRSLISLHRKIHSHSSGMPPFLKLPGCAPSWLPTSPSTGSQAFPKENEDGSWIPCWWTIYNTNAFIRHCRSAGGSNKIRGVDVVMLGFSPFQYNPVTKELLVYKDIRVRVRLGKEEMAILEKPASEAVGLDPLLQDMLLNPNVLPEVELQQIKPEYRWCGLRIPDHCSEWSRFYSMGRFNQTIQD